jgi:hypothetical protein
MLALIGRGIALARLIVGNRQTPGVRLALTPNSMRNRREPLARWHSGRHSGADIRWRVGAQLRGLRAAVLTRMTSSNDNDFVTGSRDVKSARDAHHTPTQKRQLTWPDSTGKPKQLMKPVFLIHQSWTNAIRK